MWDDSSVVVNVLATLGGAVGFSVLNFLFMVVLLVLVLVLVVGLLDSLSTLIL